MRKKTLAGVGALLAIALVLGLRIVGFSIPFGLSPLVVAFVLVPILIDEASGIISLRPSDQLLDDLSA
jgi:hypothetical protein